MLFFGSNVAFSVLFGSKFKFKIHFYVHQFSYIRLSLDKKVRKLDKGFREQVRIKSININRDPLISKIEKIENLGLKNSSMVKKQFNQKRYQRIREPVKILETQKTFESSRSRQDGAHVCCLREQFCSTFSVLMKGHQANSN